MFKVITTLVLMSQLVGLSFSQSKITVGVEDEKESARKPKAAETSALKEHKKKLSSKEFTELEKEITDSEESTYDEVLNLKRYYQALKWYLTPATMTEEAKNAVCKAIGEVIDGSDTACDITSTVFIIGGGAALDYLLIRSIGLKIKIFSAADAKHNAALSKVQESIDADLDKAANESTDGKVSAEKAKQIVKRNLKKAEFRLGKLKQTARFITKVLKLAGVAVTTAVVVSEVDSVVHVSMPEKTFSEMTEIIDDKLKRLDEILDAKIVD